MDDDQDLVVKATRPQGRLVLLYSSHFIFTLITYELYQYNRIYFMLYPYSLITWRCTFYISFPDIREEREESSSMHILPRTLKGSL